MKRLLLLLSLFLTSIGANATCAVNGRILAVVGLGQAYQGSGIVYISPTGNWNNFYFFLMDQASQYAAAASGKVHYSYASIYGNASSCGAQYPGYGGVVEWIGVG